MITFGVHRAKTISLEPVQIEIGDRVVDFDYPNPELGDTISVLYGFNRTFKFLEKITPKMIDEVTLRNQLEPVFVIPATGTVNSVFGPRRSPTGMGDEFHEGVDIGAEENTPIYSIDAGEVIETHMDDDTSYGTFVRIAHPSKIISIYAHLNQIDVAQGQIVEQGQHIGLMGNTGKSSGPHLHLGLEYLGKALNPRVFYPSHRLLLGQKVRALEI